MSQGNNERVPSFATRLVGGDPQPNSAPVPREDDGPRGPTTPQGSPLSGVRKPIHDSIQYLYGTPGILSPQLMIAAQMVVSKNEKTSDWVRMKVTVTMLEGMAKLKHQITQLMGALTQTG